MAELPIMPFHVDAYLGDTTGFSNMEHGAYLLLLFAMWRAGGGIPNDDVRLARIARISVKQWHRVQPAIMRHCRVQGAFLIQPMLLQSLDIVRQKRNKNADAARARWLKHKGRLDAFAMRTQSERNANQIKERRENKPEPEPEPKNGQAEGTKTNVVPIAASDELVALLNGKRRA